MLTVTLISPAGTMKDEMSKHRLKLHMKVLGPGSSAPRLKEDKPTYKEKFVPPEVSMISYFMTKVTPAHAPQAPSFFLFLFVVDVTLID